MSSSVRCLLWGRGAGEARRSGRLARQRGARPSLSRSVGTADMSTAPRFVSGPLLRTATSLGAPLHGGTRPLAAVAAAAPLAPATPPLPLILLLLVLFLLSMLFPQIVSVITMPLKTLFHGFRALFYPPWFYFLVMFFWYGYKCAARPLPARHSCVCGPHALEALRDAPALLQVQLGYLLQAERDGSDVHPRGIRLGLHAAIRQEDGLIVSLSRGAVRRQRGCTCLQTAH